MEQVHVEYWEIDIVKVNVFNFLNEETEGFTSRWSQSLFFFFFFYMGFLSRTFTNHRTAGEGGGHFINSSLPLPPTSQTLRH